MKNPLDLKGLATGIGSLPHKDPKEAVDLVLKYLPQTFFWPQLPNLNKNEAMTAQFIEGMPCLRMKDGNVIFDDLDMDNELEDFYAKIIAKDVEAFRISKDFSSGLDYLLKVLGKAKDVKFIKGQITGPITYGASIKDKDGAMLLNNRQMMEAIINSLVMKALWQIKKFKSYCRNVIIFIDEPYLSCFGSAYTPVDRLSVIKILTSLISLIRQEEDVFLGLHCCGNTDWSMLMELDLDILNFDSYGYFDRLALYAQDLKKFFFKGGILAWGVIPTNDYAISQAARGYLNRFLHSVEHLVSKGIDRKFIVNQIMFTPSCGMGTLDAERAKAILSTLGSFYTDFLKSI